MTGPRPAIAGLVKARAKEIIKLLLGKRQTFIIYYKIINIIYLILLEIGHAARVVKELPLKWTERE